MANYVKISLLSQPALSHSPYSDDLEGKVQEMLAYLNENLQKVLPDKPDLIVVPEACDRFPSFTMEERKRYYRYRGDRIRDFYRDIARENRCPPLPLPAGGRNPPLPELHPAFRPQRGDPWHLRQKSSGSGGIGQRRDRLRH